MQLRDECSTCPQHIKPTDGCTRIAVGLACTFPTTTPEDSPKTPVLDIQIGGDHYKKMGAYQPWLVLQAHMTPEEFRGYMKGNAIVYLLREGKKGTDEDIAKAGHTLEGLLELIR